MPVVKHNGRFIQVPYDPAYLAELIYNGFQVYPDAGTLQDETKQHESEISQHLRRLWGGQPGRIVPGETSIRGPETLWDRGNDRIPGQTYQKPGLDWGTDYRTFEPNPFTDYSIEQAEPFQKPTMQTTRRTPLGLRQAVSQARGTGLTVPRQRDTFDEGDDRYKMPGLTTKKTGRLYS